MLHTMFRESSQDYTEVGNRPVSVAYENITTLCITIA